MSLLDADFIKGNSPEVQLHELGHNLGLDHSEGTMSESLNGSINGVSKSDLEYIYIGLGATGAENKNGKARKHRNYSKSRAIDFLKKNTSEYDKNKAKQAGIN